jgi:cytochrome c biogenesis protein CcdA
VLGALAVVVVIGLADSLNATTIGPALYLATARGHAGPVIAFAAGVFVVSFLGGIAVVLGLGQLVLGAVPDLSATAKQLIEVGAGAFLLALALVFWARRDRPPGSKLPDVGSRSATSFALGAGVMAVELPTALPYFAAIAAILAASGDLAVRIALLAAFNLMFVLPLIAIVAILELAGDHAPRYLGRVNAWLGRHANVVIAGLALVAGIALVAFGTIGLTGH